MGMPLEYEDKSTMPACCGLEVGGVSIRLVGGEQADRNGKSQKILLAMRPFFLCNNNSFLIFYRRDFGAVLAKLRQIRDHHGRIMFQNGRGRDMRPSWSPKELRLASTWSRAHLQLVATCDQVATIFFNLRTLDLD